MLEVADRVLVEALIRARALEAELCELRPPGLPEVLRGPLPVSPAVQAALAVAGGPVREPDLLCLRRASPAAALVLGVPAETLAHEAAGSRSARASGRSPGGVPDALDRGLLSAVDPPGTMVEVMAGVALAFRMRRESRAAVLVDDADASASGYWHEGLNFAAVQRAPLVLVLDGSRRHPLTAKVPRLTARAPAYGLRAVNVEGDDPRLVFEAVADAVSRARGGDGTQLVEVVSSRDADPVHRLLRTTPSLAEGIDEFRGAAEAEARRAAEAAREAGPPEGRAARHPTRPGGPEAPPIWSPPVRPRPDAPEARP